MSKVCVLLAPGFEEIEAITIIDVLRRAEIDTAVVSVDDEPSVTGSHGITVGADAGLSHLQGTFDMLVLPGGMPGSKNLRDSEAVQTLLKQQAEAGRKLAAICAAPIALSRAGVLADKQATSYPAFQDQIDCAGYRQDPVVVDGNVITSRAPGTALRFALRLVAELKGGDLAAELAEGMLVDT